MKKNIIFISVAVLIVVILIVLSTFGGKEIKAEENMLNIEYPESGNEMALNYDTENPVVAMHIENYGSIVMELYPNVATNTVNNFISLVKSGFYDNNTFHRLVKGFVLQGGDPTGEGSGGPGYSIKGEFSENGYENNLSHTKGIVSMARATANDTAGSQFFICLEDATSLDGKYAAFGKIIDGWDNIERIAKTETISDQASGKLVRNLKLKKAVIDLKGKEYEEVEKVDD